MAANKNKIKRYFLITITSTMQPPNPLSRLLSSYVLSPLAFEQPCERSNGYAIRLHIASARFLRFSQNRSAIRAWKIYSTREILGLFYNGARIDSALWVRPPVKIQSLQLVTHSALPVSSRCGGVY